MTASRVEAVRALCADLDDSIQMTIENRIAVRVLALIEPARADLQRDRRRGAPVVEIGLKAK